MSTIESSRAVTRIALETLTKYRFVRHGTAGRVGHSVLTANGAVDGIVLEDGIVALDNVPIAIPDGGSAKVQAGGVIAVGAHVTTNGSGQAIAAASGNAIVGTHLGSVAAAANDIIEIQFAHKGALP